MTMNPKSETALISIVVIAVVFYLVILAVFYFSKKLEEKKKRLKAAAIKRELMEKSAKLQAKLDEIEELENARKKALHELDRYTKLTQAINDVTGFSPGFAEPMADANGVVDPLEEAMYQAAAQQYAENLRFMEAASEMVSLAERQRQ